MSAPRQIEIWFFIGALLFLYGVLITGAGIYHLFNPPVRHIALGELHADVWWGVLLLALGAFYATRFRPWRNQAPPRR